MRRLLPVAMLLAAGCGLHGPTRLRPGSDVAMPEHVGMTESLLRSLACSAQKRDSLEKTPAGSGREQIRTSCGALKDTIKR